MFCRAALSLFFLISLVFGQQILPGAKVRIVCEQEPTLCVERIVSPDGVVDLPLLGRVILAGSTRESAERDLEARASARLGLAGIRIAIHLMDRDGAPIEFGGAVVRSGVAPFSPGLTLGQIADLASPDGALAGQSAEIASADGKSLIVDVDSNRDLALKPGDRVTFQRATGANEVYVLGGVQRPGAKLFDAEMTVRGAIALAGGVTGHGRPGKIRLERGGIASTFALESAEAAQKLRRGDVVLVPVVENGRYISVIGIVMKPGSVEFREGMTLTEAIRGAGGAGMFASGDVVVKRMGQWTRTYNLTKIRESKQDDLVLLSGDILDVQQAKWRPIDKPTPKTREKGGPPVVPPL